MSPWISTYVLTMDSSLPCISHIASFRQNNMIAWKERPRFLYMKTKRALNSLLLLLLLLYFEKIFPWPRPPFVNGQLDVFHTHRWRPRWHKRGYEKVVRHVWPPANASLLHQTERKTSRLFQRRNKTASQFWNWSVSAQRCTPWDVSRLIPAYVGSIQNYS